MGWTCGLLGAKAFPRRAPNNLEPFRAGLRQGSWKLIWQATLPSKVELFDKRWKAWLLLALGAIPVRRGESDDDAMETARLILERGGAVGIFPEGTRVRPGPLGEPKRGVGRLVLETGAPVVPVAVIGTERLRRSWLIRPGRVTVRCGRALTFPRPLDREPRQSVAQEISNRVWSCISLQWEWLGGLPPIRHPVVVGAGSWGTAVAMLLARYSDKHYAGVYYAKAQNLRRRLRAAYDAVLAKYDLLLLPTTPMMTDPIPPAGAPLDVVMTHCWQAITNTCPFNVTGHPAISLPCGFGKGARPIGLMLVGKHFDEMTIYRAAHAFERSGDWQKMGPARRGAKAAKG